MKLFKTLPVVPLTLAKFGEKSAREKRSDPLAGSDPDTWNPSAADGVGNCTPDGWTDMWGIDCDRYLSEGYCTADGKPGINWPNSAADASLAEYASVFEGKTYDARQCRQCGCSEESDVVGNWEQWEHWSACDKNCGFGERTRVRSCPSNTCPGDDSESDVCNTGSCDGEWGHWGQYSPCSTTCWGTTSRTRECLPSWEGAFPVCENDDDTEESPCNTSNCENTDSTGLCAPEVWKDSFSQSCQDYEDKKLCTADGEIGEGWPDQRPEASFTAFQWYSNGKLFNGGQCPQCGCAEEPVQACATMYSAYSSFKNGDKSVIADTGEVADLSAYKGENWSKRVSYVKIEPNCVFEGYQDKNFERLLGRWRGQIDSTNSHEMDAKYENNKMKSFKCSCKENKTCVDHYSFGNDLKKRCPAPLCDVVETQVFDSWKKKRGEQFRYGFALKIKIPEEYWGNKGWSILLRFNSAKINSGNFQLWNANFFNVFRKSNGLEILIHQKYYTANDLTDPHSFVLVAEKLTTSLIPEVYFWSHRETRHNCFDSNMHRSSSTSALDRAIKSNAGISDIDEVSHININSRGNVRVKG